MTMSVSFAGVTNFAGFLFPFGPGSFPSTFTLFGPAFALARTGSLAFSQTETGASITFPDCTLYSVTEIGGVTAYHFHDRRAKWAGGSYTAEHNVPITGGPGLLYERTPRDIASDLLDLIGETGYDVSELPNDPRPYINGAGQDPRHVLDYLCELLGCWVTLGLDNVVRIRRFGTGTAASTTNQILNPLTYPAGTYAANVGVDYSPTVYRSWLKLKGLVRQASGAFVDWATVDPAEWIRSPDAMRFYEIEDTFPVALTVPSLGLINSFDQVELVESDTAIRGKFHTGEYCGVTHATLQEYRYPFAVHGYKKIVEFHKPVFKTGTNGETEACDELYLETDYRVRLENGPLVNRVRSAAQTGDSARLDALLSVPSYDYIIADYDAAGAITGTTTNATGNDVLSDDLIAAAEPAHQEYSVQPKRNAGFIAAEPGGMIPQVTWSAGLPNLDVGGAPMTWIGGGLENYVHAAGYAQRRSNYA